ncbi:MAG: hypothetical protein NT079_03875, partial [Candidatus Omnitrophica bacterium]|nr:hypothetical protein [Candidatus Omnitrophota bacterium]
MSKFTLPNFKIKENIGYIVIGIAMALILVVDVIIFLRPQFTAMASVGRKVSELSSDIKKTRYNVKHISSLEAEVGQLQKKLSGVMANLVGHQETAMVIDDVSQLAAKYAVQINQ